MSDEKMVKLVYVGRHSEVEVRDPETDAAYVVARGSSIDVPERLAGHAAKGDPDSEDYEAGSGLLAQGDNWVKPGTKAAKEAPPPAETTGVEPIESAPEAAAEPEAAPTH